MLIPLSLHPPNHLTKIKDKEEEKCIAFKYEVEVPSQLEIRFGEKV
jgi:hypothetical protein